MEPRGQSRADLENLYRRYGLFLLRRCRVILRDPEQANDALQEAFVKVMRSDVSLDTVEHPLPWLYRVVDHVCLALLRRRKTTPTPGAGDVDEAELASPTSGALGPEHAAEERDRVLKFLGELDDVSQQIALLSFVDGMNQGEIAEELGYSRVTINKRVQALRQRAQTRLRDGLADSSSVSEQP